MNPFLEKGINIEEQVKNWNELNLQPYDKKDVHPYTRARIILMNAVELEGAAFSQRMSQLSSNIELRRSLAFTRRMEEKQQKIINWLLPPDESTIENTLAYEQMEIDLASQLAVSEQNKDVKAVFDYSLADDFDHLYRFANLYEMVENKSAENIVGGHTEIFPGRPSITGHVHPFDTIKKNYDAGTAGVLTKLHVLTFFAAEQHTLNYYHTAGNLIHDTSGRALYQEIAMAEEQHVTMSGSLPDPSQSMLDLLVLHEYNECYMYYSCMLSEVDDRIKGIWRNMLAEELEHLRIASGLMREYDKKDASELYGEFPEPAVFRSDKDYIRNIIGAQIDLTNHGTSYLQVNKLPGDSLYFSWRRAVNDEGLVPSEEIIRQNMEARNRDYRIETEGPHPVERLRSRELIIQ